MSGYYTKEGHEAWVKRLIRRAAWRVWDEKVGPELTERMRRTLMNGCFITVTDPDDVWETVETEARYIVTCELSNIQADIAKYADRLFKSHDADLGAWEMREGRYWTDIEPPLEDIQEAVDEMFDEETVGDMVLGMAIAVAYFYNMRVRGEW